MELAGSNQAHDGVENTELASGQSANHDATRGQARRAELDEADLRGNDAEALEDAAGATRAGLVDLRKSLKSKISEDNLFLTSKNEVRADGNKEERIHNDKLPWRAECQQGAR